jgi:hypothetical protein
MVCGINQHKHHHVISLLSGVAAGQRFPCSSSSSRLLLTFILQIDTKAVAGARGYKNPRSVANRITNLKKRYNLPITASQSGSRKVGDSSPSSEVQVPVTPNKNKVTKARTTRGRAVKVPKKAGKATTSGSEESDGDSDEKGMIYAAPKKLSKLLNTTTDESSGGEDTKSFINKAQKVSDEEEAEASDGGAEGQEDGDEMEESEALKVEVEHNDEV